LLCVASHALAQTGPALPEQVLVTASGAERRSFETPYAASVVDADALRGAGPMVNLSEALARVPGIVVSNRSNYAQDLQINSRGFGARASFGVRGIRLYTDGIPASGPDGQGQVSHFDLAGAQRVEVLRGPFSALFGSSSGGVIALVSAAPTRRQYSSDGDIGSDGLRQWRIGIDLPWEGGFSIRAQASRFATDGSRPQSSARRTLGNIRFGWDGERDRVVAIVNTLNQPALDPLGLTRAQFDQNPDQTAGIALPQDTAGQPDRFNTRKNTRQDQTGISWRHRFDEAGALRESALAAYEGRRSVTQWQAIPVATQLNPTNPTATARQPGGVIDFDRDYGGLDGRLVWRWALDGGRSAQLVAGASLDRSNEDRRGYENFTGSGAGQLLGVTGKLRRDERNRADGRDSYAQGEFEWDSDWTTTAGLRHGSVGFRSIDRYIVGANGDDSGALAYQYTNPVAALQWRARPGLNVYLSAGRGFESPTLSELAYRPDGQGGFNSDLKAQTSRQAELGAKWHPVGAGLAIDAALFEARTDDEIGVATNRGGRSTFRNVGPTKRRGAEVSARWRIDAAWRTQAALTWLDATYVDGFLVCSSVPCAQPDLPVTAGNRIAGTLARTAFAEIAWLPLAGAEFGLELRAQGSLPVNDANSDFAAGFGQLALRAQWAVDAGPGRLELLGRVDNVAGRRVAASVIVNEANNRYFEPSPGRTGLLSARWSARF
jgi:iron complex outermembrane receptor protein